MTALTDKLIGQHVGPWRVVSIHHDDPTKPWAWLVHRKSPMTQGRMAVKHVLEAAGL